MYYAVRWLFYIIEILFYDLIERRSLAEIIGFMTLGNDEKIYFSRLLMAKYNYKINVLRKAYQSLSQTLLKFDGNYVS